MNNVIFRILLSISLLTVTKEDLDFFFLFVWKKIYKMENNCLLFVGISGIGRL